MTQEIKAYPVYNIRLGSRNWKLLNGGLAPPQHEALSAMRQDDFAELLDGMRKRMKPEPTGVVHPVIAVFDEMQEVVESKAHDYAKDDNVFSNFEFAADVAGVTVEQEFAVMIATKVARLRELLGGKVPNNESLDDTLLDLANYAALCLAWRRQQEDR